MFAFKGHPSVSCAWLLLPFLFLIGGCSSAPPYERPKVDVPAKYKEDIQWTTATADSHDTQLSDFSSEWWKLFGDDQLNDLAQRALRANQSIVAASAAYKNAIAAVAENQAGLMPQVTAGVASTDARDVLYDSSRQKLYSYVEHDTRAGMAVSWEPDLWKTISKKIDQAKELAQLSDAERAAQKLSVISLVASDYFMLRKLDLEITLRLQQRDTYLELINMSERDVHLGLASNDDLLDAQKSLSELDSIIPQLRRDRAKFEHALAFLVGESPSEFSLDAIASYSFQNISLPPSVPSQLLERRPDVIGGERRVAAANSSVGIAQDAYFPTLNLNGSAGFENTSFLHLMSAPFHFWSVGPSLAGTLFDGGARSARVDQATANYEQEVALYRNTVLSAFADVEDNLAAKRFNDDWNHAAEKNAEQSLALLNSQKRLLKLGLASRRDTLNMQQTYMDAKFKLYEAVGETARTNVLLIKALGGGWAPLAANQ